MPQMSAALDRGMQLMTTVEQDLSNVWSLIAQEVSYALQQYEHLLGITAIAPNQSIGSTAPQAGSSTMIDHQAAHPAPRFEPLDDPLSPAATVNLIWDPTNGKNASSAANWDVGMIGGVHPANPPGNNPGETDNVFFDGSKVMKNNNSNCTWDYTPMGVLGSVSFQNGYNQTVSFADKEGFSVSLVSQVVGAAKPIINPNGNSGANAVAAITLTNGAYITVSNGSTLNLQGWATGHSIYFAKGDNKTGEYLNNNGTVSYLGVGAATTDYMLIPVHNTSVFTVNRMGISSGSTLQVSGTDATNTDGVSFYQDNSLAETDILGGGTLWCANDYTMSAGLLQSKDSGIDTLKVGTSGNSPVDGTVKLTGGSVKIYPGMGNYGMLQILGTTGANKPTVNVGSAELDFKVSMTVGSSLCDVLYVGSTAGTGNINFNYNGGSSTVGIQAQGGPTKPHAWKVLYFGMRDGTPSVAPVGMYTPNWSNPKILEIDYQ